LQWSQATGAESYNIQYRKVGTTSWWTLHADGSVTQKKLNQLLPETQYEWRIQSSCADGALSHYSILQQFTTLPMKISSEPEKQSLLIYPNPVSDLMNIRVPDDLTGEVNVRVIDFL